MTEFKLPIIGTLNVDTNTFTPAVEEEIVTLNIVDQESDDDPDYCPHTRNHRHSWVVADEDNGGDGHTYCEYCGVGES